MDLTHLGLILGFFGAVCQAINYAVTKDVQQKYTLSGLRLLNATHVLLFICAFIPFLICEHFRYVDEYSIFYSYCIILPYLGGQYFTNKAIGLSDSSIVSPLLTIKIPILALISLFMLGKGFNLQQTAAIIIILSLGWYFSSLSGRIAMGSLACVGAGCLCYCLSDLAMGVLLMPYFKAVGVESWVQQVFLGCTFEYVFCGVFALPLLFTGGHQRINLRDVWETRWIGVTWLLNMAGIVSCFNLAGVVDGNIVQSLRSVIGVIIAYLFFRKYIKDHTTFRKKLFIALAMFAAVGIYYL